MSTHRTYSNRIPSFRRLWKPVAFTGAGGTAIAIWQEDVIALGTEILALLFLPIMAGGVYLLDVLIFRSRMPRRADLENPATNGVKK